MKHENDRGSGGPEEKPTLWIFRYRLVQVIGVVWVLSAFWIAFGVPGWEYLPPLVGWALLVIGGSLWVLVLAGMLSWLFTWRRKGRRRTHR